MREEELAQKLQDAGFPAITRWAIENNQRRPISVTGKPTLPLLGELMSEFKQGIGLEKWGNYDYVAYILEGSVREYSNTDKYRSDEQVEGQDEEGNRTYRDDHIEHFVFDRTPEKALARLYIAIKKYENRTVF